MLLIYIITPSAVALVIILCIIALLCRRCSRRQRRRKHRSEPVSLFQPTTPIFLVDRRRSDLAFTGISDPLYDLSNDSKKAVTMKHTYAQVGKGRLFLPSFYRNTKIIVLTISQDCIAKFYLINFAKFMRKYSAEMDFH